MKENDFRKRYNRYVKHYNEQKSKISAYAELETIKNGVWDQVINVKTAIDDELELVEDLLKECYSCKTLAENLEGPEILNIIAEIRSGVLSGNFVSDSDKWVDEKARIIESYCEKYDKMTLMGHLTQLEKLVLLGDRYLHIQAHYVALREVLKKIIHGNYPPDGLGLYESLSEKEQYELEEKNKYEPYHNTREGLVGDLTNILKELKSQPRFFHPDGTVKHTTVANYAVSIHWFAKKHGDSPRGLHDHIKEIHKYMKST